jgi:hypothetical protein
MADSSRETHSFPKPMTPSAHIAALRCIASIFALTLVGGCSHNKLERPTGATPQRMATLATCYSMYVGKHQGHLPSDEVALKNFIRSDCQYVLTKNGMTDADSIFVSDRDNSPLVVTYAKDSPNRALVPEMIVAHEETGVAAKRLVVLPSGVVREFNAATLDAIDQAATK